MSTIIDDDPIYTVRETAAMLGCGRTLIYSMLERGELGHYRFSDGYKQNTIRVPRSAIKAFTEKHPLTTWVHDRTGWTGHTPTPRGARIARLCPPGVWWYLAVCEDCRWTGMSWKYKQHAETERDRHNERTHPQCLNFS